MVLSSVGNTLTEAKSPSVWKSVNGWFKSSWISLFEAKLNWESRPTSWEVVSYWAKSSVEVGIASVVVWKVSWATFFVDVAGYSPKFELSVAFVFINVSILWKYIKVLII